MNRSSCLPSDAVVALLRLLDAHEIRVELVLLEEGGAVDALQHLPLRVAAPIGAGGVRQLEVLEARRVGHVRAATEIDERPVGVGRDDFVVAELREALELERIVGEALLRFARDSPPRARTDTSRPTTFRISFSNAARSSGVNGCGDLEVVVEAVVDRRTEADLRVGTQPADGGREHVRRRVAQHVERARVAVGEHAEACRSRAAASTRSWMAPLTSTATAACSSRSPIDFTTSDGSVPGAHGALGSVGERQRERRCRRSIDGRIMMLS